MPNETSIPIQEPRLKDTHKPKAKNVEERLDEIEILLRQNMQWSEIIYKDVKKIRRRLLVTRIWGWIKITLLIAPLILAAIVLPPYIQSVKKWYVDNIETPRVQFENNINKLNRYLPGNN